MTVRYNGELALVTHSNLKGKVIIELLEGIRKGKSIWVTLREIENV